MATPQTEFSIDDYFRKRLMPVDSAIPLLAGIEMYGNSIPAGSVGGDRALVRQTKLCRMNLPLEQIGDHDVTECIPGFAW